MRSAPAERGQQWGFRGRTLRAAFEHNLAVRDDDEPIGEVADGLRSPSADDDGQPIAARQRAQHLKEGSQVLGFQPSVELSDDEVVAAVDQRARDGETDAAGWVRDRDRHLRFAAETDPTERLERKPRRARPEPARARRIARGAPVARQGRRHVHAGDDLAEAPRRVAHQRTASHADATLVGKDSPRDRVEDRAPFVESARDDARELAALESCADPTDSPAAAGSLHTDPDELDHGRIMRRGSLPADDGLIMFSSRRAGADSGVDAFRRAAPPNR
jgi:hypothetical protein